MRRCPNNECNGLVFIEVVNSRLVKTHPPEIVDFDSTNLPVKILNSLVEAISCHAAEAYKASALMIRRVLEELCADKRATGDNLKQKIVSLSSTAIVPQELLDVADELRLLGNDAAHIEAKSYDEIGKNESELAIELAKELLKAVYQYSSLVAKLRALKK